MLHKYRLEEDALLDCLGAFGLVCDAEDGFGFVKAVVKEEKAC